jgi:probable F420-dependent oxidoreductase
MTIGIGLGISQFPFNDAEDYFQWLRHCEAGGVDSIWQTDRIISKQPMLECFVAMAAIAGATAKIRFGFNVASIALRDPIMVAKQCATIDMLSKGRLLPAFGLGSAMSQDYVATGTPTKRRGKKADEALELVSRLWREDDVTFQGEFYQYKAATISPKPHNARIPLWIGGSSDVAIKRTARIGTGWLGGIDSPASVGRVIRGIKAELTNLDRDIDEDHYGATFSFRIGDKDHPAVQSAAARFKQLGKDPNDYLVAGDAAAVVSRVNEYIDAGASKFVLLPIAANSDDMFQQTELTINEVLAAF